MDKVIWSRWINAIVTAAQELKEAGFQMSLDPSEDNDVFQNLLAISAAEWREGDNAVPLGGPGMGRSGLHDEESYSPLQINMATWGEDTSDVDVTIINSPYVEEFQGITREELIDLITTDPKLAAKAGIIVLNSNTGYNNWTTWDDFVNNPETPKFKQYAGQYDNDITRGLEPVEPTDSTTTTTTTMPEETTTTTTMPEDTTPPPVKSEESAKYEYQSQVPKKAPTFEEAQYMTRMRRLNPNFRKENFLKYFDRVTSFTKPDETKFTKPSVGKAEDIVFPYGTPVTTQEVLDLLEP